MAGEVKSEIEITAYRDALIMCNERFLTQKQIHERNGMLRILAWMLDKPGGNP